MSAQNSPSIENIMKVGFGFMPAKVLMTAVELDVFTIIAKAKSAKAAEIKKQLNLLCNDRQAYDFLDALVGLGFLERQGVLETALYSNSRDTDHFLDRNKPTYLGGGLELGNSRIYRMWGCLGEALKTGERLNEGDNMFDQIYKSPEKLQKFVNGMGDLQAVGFSALAQKFDFSKYQNLIDIGGSGAKLSITVAQKHPHLSCRSLDLPPVQPIAKVNIIKSKLQTQVETGILDFFKDDFPKADVITMGNILHDWDQNQKEHLLRSSFKALNEGGAFIAIQNVIDDDRRKNVYGLQMSLTMLLDKNGGFDYTFKQFTEWALSAGFKRTELIHLVGPKSAAVAYK